MKRLLHGAIVALILNVFLAATSGAPPVLAQTRTEAPTGEAIVHAVLFYSPSCPHCHEVITEVLPPLLEKYGAQLRIVGVNTAEPSGQAMYQVATERFDITGSRIGVPTLIVDEVVLVGSGEIPAQLPGLIEQYLSEGGVNWPDIPGLDAALARSQPTPEPTAVGTQTDEATPVATATPPAGLQLSGDTTGGGLGARFARDIMGNSLATIVLLGLIASLVYIGAGWRRIGSRADATWQDRAVPVLAVLGMGVAAYLAYVETSEVAAVCGPVGDCNTVQQSQFARLFGFLPIGVFGLIGYILILVAYAIRQLGNGPLAQMADAGMFVMCLFGVAFSTYLTFLEPFVIGATCAWCLTSAVVMTLLLLLSAGPGIGALANMLGDSSSNPKAQHS